ncbi:MAG: metallopeptidase family protein [Actinomycetota bacterium]
MSNRDRRGRGIRADNDLRHRPTDGFRTASTARFLVLVRGAVAALPGDLRTHLDPVELVVTDVPSRRSLEEVRPSGDVPLAHVGLARDETPARLTVYRRPVELRASTREELQGLLARAVEDAVRDALGLGPST